MLLKSQSNFIQMRILFFSIAALSISFTQNAFSQFDDLYYNPANNTQSLSASVASTNETFANPISRENQSYDDQSYDDNSYSYSNDEESEYRDEDYYQDYSYSTRIRRFHRPSCGISYFSLLHYDVFDPYVNYYDPFWYGGNNTTVVISIGSPYYGGWAWNRWHSWNHWDRWHSWNHWDRWNSWNNWYNWNYGWNNACYTGGWNNGGWWNNNNNGVNDNNPNGTFYGSRRNSSTSSSTKGKIEGPRFTTPKDDTKITQSLVEDEPNKPVMGRTGSPRGDFKNGNPEKSALSNSEEANESGQKHGINTERRNSIYNRKFNDKSYKSERPSRSEGSDRSYKSDNPSRSEGNKRAYKSEDDKSARNQQGDSPRRSQSNSPSHESPRHESPKREGATRNDSPSRSYDSPSRSSGSNGGSSSGRSSGGGSSSSSGRSGSGRSGGRQ